MSSWRCPTRKFLLNTVLVAIDKSARAKQAYLSARPEDVDALALAFRITKGAERGAVGVLDDTSSTMGEQRSGTRRERAGNTKHKVSAAAGPVAQSGQRVGLVIAPPTLFFRMFASSCRRRPHSAMSLFVILMVVA